MSKTRAVQPAIAGDQILKLDMQSALNATVIEIRRALRVRSGKAWSVTRQRGTAYGWINVTAPSSRQTNYQMSAEDTAELGSLFGLRGGATSVLIPDTPHHWAEFVERANGRVPTVYGHQYWD